MYLFGKEIYRVHDHKQSYGTTRSLNGRDSKATGPPQHEPYFNLPSLERTQ